MITPTDSMPRERRPRPRAPSSFKYPIWLKAPLILIGLSLVVVVMSFGKFILMPLAFAALISILLSPVIQKFESWKLNRISSILLGLLLIIVVFSGIMSLIAIQIIQFADQIPEIADSLKSATAQGFKLVEGITGVTVQEQTEYARNGIANFFETGGEFIRTFMSATRDALLFFGLLPIFIFFMLYYKEMYQTFLEKSFATSQNSKIDQVIVRVKKVTQNYLVGLFIVMTIMAILNTIGLFIIGLEYALFWGVFASVLAVIPFIGAILGSVPPILFAFIIQDSLILPLLVLAVFVSVQLIESSILTPRIIGSQVSINPMVAIIFLFIGGEIWGIGGMILFIPLIGMLRVGFTQVEELKPYAYLLGNVKEYKRVARNEEVQEKAEIQ